MLRDAMGLFGCKQRAHKRGASVELIFLQLKWGDASIGTGAFHGGDCDSDGAAGCKTRG